MPLHTCPNYIRLFRSCVRALHCIYSQIYDYRCLRINKIFLKPLKMQKSFNYKYININLDSLWIFSKYFLSELYQDYSIWVNIDNWIEVRFWANWTKVNSRFCIHQSAAGSWRVNTSTVSSRLTTVTLFVCISIGTIIWTTVTS